MRGRVQITCVESLMLRGGILLVFMQIGARHDAGMKGPRHVGIAHRHHELDASIRFFNACS